MITDADILDTLVVRLMTIPSSFAKSPRILERVTAKTTSVAAIKAVGTLLSAHQAPSTLSSALTMCAVPLGVTKQRVTA
ncbi:hypothetical protein VDGE_30563 [Verticillium dahliae]|uniref:Uncharacterized protein n=1 Tax=Verticillium dahliae TaxID=27337 RepID=A0A444RQ87_VERDA|nr:hypothetical protein VDGE_30563 [Verticillium dahliae]